MDRQAQRERAQGWLEVGRREGLTFRALAERSGLSVKTLHRWQARLRREGEQRGLDVGSSPFVELAVTEREQAAPALTSRDLGGSRMEVVLSHGRRVVVPVDFDEAALMRVVRALERC